jgi:hypothetical protein
VRSCLPLAPSVPRLGGHLPLTAFRPNPLRLWAAPAVRLRYHPESSPRRSAGRNFSVSVHNTTVAKSIVVEAVASKAEIEIQGPASGLAVPGVAVATSVGPPPGPTVPSATVVHTPSRRRRVTNSKYGPHGYAEWCARNATVKQPSTFGGTLDS